MKTIFKKLLIYSTIFLFIAIGLFYIVDLVVMPSVVESVEHELPNFEGKSKEEAVSMLQSLNLNPVVEGPRYDERVPKDHVIFQNPRPGTMVKENRRIYIYVSGGDPLISMPDLNGKTIRDARVTVNRLGLIMGEVEQIRSEYPRDLIIGQKYDPGTRLAKGDTVSLQVSVGPQVGKIRVPNIIGQVVATGERKLRENSLRLGKITYIASRSLLPNTIIEQYPSPDELVPYGDSVDVFVAKNVQ
ncbi:MAG: hypothetical protein SCALA702_28450 [Melioribacteraceae bacterium]|nr:MAG: hypothetical protein SCALA702_28450 [Melioribacteraceae bacterium]